MLTLSVSTPTLLVEQGFAGFSGSCLMQCRDALATTLHHAVPYAVQVSIRRHPLVRRLPKRAVRRSSHRAAAVRRRTIPSRSAVQVSGMAVLPQRAVRARYAPGSLAHPYANSKSAVFHNASLNAHIEWRFS